MENTNYDGAITRGDSFLPSSGSNSYESFMVPPLLPKGFMAENQDHIYSKQLNLLVVGEERLRSNKLYDGKIKREFIFHLSLSPALVAKNPIMHKQAAFPEAGDWTCAILEASGKMQTPPPPTPQSKWIELFSLLILLFRWKSVWKSVLWKEGSLPFLPWLFVVQKYFPSINLNLEG